MKQIKSGQLVICADDKLNEVADTIAINQNIRLPVYSEKDLHQYCYLISLMRPDSRIDYPSLFNLRCGLGSISNKDSLRYRAVLAHSGIDRPSKYIHVFGHEHSFEEEGFGHSSLTHLFYNRPQDELLGVRIGLENALATASECDEVGFEAHLVNNLSIADGAAFAEADNRNPVHKHNLELLKIILGTFARHFRSGANPRKIYLGNYELNYGIETSYQTYERVWNSIVGGNVYA